MPNEDTSKDDEEKMFLEKHYSTNYNVRELDNNEKRELKIILHSLEGEEVQLKLENLFDKTQQGELNIESSSKINIPYDDNSLFGVYRDNQELISLFKNFFTFIDNYTAVQELPLQQLITNIKEGKTEKCKNFKDQKLTKKIILENMFNFSLNCGTETQINNSEFNLAFDLNKFSHLFFTSTPDKTLYSKIFRYDYISDRNPLYNPTSVKQSTKNYIFSRYKNYLYANEVTEPDDEYQKIVTFYNIYNLLKNFLPINKVLYFKLSETEDKLTEFFVTKEIQINEKYRELNKVTNTVVEFHYDIELKKKDEVEYVKININLNGDIKRSNINFLPKMLDPKNDSYQESDIYFSNKLKITESILNRDTFKKKYGSKLDKRLFFLDKDFMKFLVKNIKTDDKEDDPATKEKKYSKNHKNNVDLLIKLFFRQSNDKKHKRNGLLFYEDKEYFINKISNIDYYLGSDKDYENIKISFKDATIFLEYDDFIDKNNIKVIVNKSAKDLYKLNPDNENLKNNLDKFKKYKEQYYRSIKISNPDEEFKKLKYVSLTTKVKRDVGDDIDIKIDKVPFSSIEIVNDKDNIEFISESVDYIYYKKEKWELANKDEKDKDTFKTNLKDKIFLVKDKGNFTYNKLKATNSTNKELKNVYKISLDLNVLDKGSGPINLTRRLFSSTCNQKCKDIDKSIQTTFGPIVGKDFNFFKKLLEKTKDRDKFDFQKIIEKKFPKEKEIEQENAEDKAAKDKPDKSSTDLQTTLETKEKTKIKGGSKRITYKHYKNKNFSKNKSQKLKYKKHQKYNDFKKNKKSKKSKKTLKKFKLKNYKVTKKLTRK